ncbi:ABC-type amino acid transport substrate-binding protein [Aequitasia blattaphilus]|uniref:Transporter substrate-binding domain-containing protein n=1 Tax=Aequitasia blattaphilus TaxID=2949332 RepID=A0ABT1E7M0_9FIRM|nr:transporter substrate-binding domain-containing protein [Aequitasia blattaphilus]MCP1101830.1 transporter substrate-binding domain-containing protein [Aequitasia blattaphilus]MCR8614470.1 transporter substrate-binding domain-containing protein [Aequitasia blattaphilus]
MKKNLLTAITVTLVLGILFTGCSKKDSTQKNSDTSNKNLIKTGELLIGMCPEYPPFESVNEEGNIEGFDVDLATAIGDELGLETSCVNTPWEGLIAGLQNKDFDIIMSGMSPEEAKEAGDIVNVTDSYYSLKEIIVTTDKSISNKEDLADKKVGCHTGSASEFALQHLIESGVSAEAIPYNRHSEAYADLLNGNLDAMVVELPWAEQKIEENSDAIIVDDPVQVFEIAGVLAKGSDSLTDDYNKALKTLKDNGKYDEIVNKWFVEE